MQLNDNTKGKHLTYDDRKNIERWNKEGKSNREIARLLGKSHQTINNEIKRGLVDLTYVGDEIKYSFELSQIKYNDNRQASGAFGKWDKDLVEIIKEKINNKISCEIISQIDGMPCFKTIYNWIYKGWINGISKKNLIYPRKPKTKYKKVGDKPKKENALSIEDRPDYIDNRSEIGHYEIDLVILTKNKGRQLLTLTDRCTRHEIIRIVKDKSADSINREIKKIRNVYNIKSITSDNGSEFLKLDEAIDCPIYYAHPYASYERGSNENANRMIRRWIPKKSTIRVTKKLVERIENWINDYPRKMFGYKSSNEYITQNNFCL